MHYELLLTNVLMSLSVMFTVGAGVLVYKRSLRSPVTVTFLLISITLGLFQLSHVVGINITDPYVSRAILMFNLVNIPFVCLNAHWIFAMTGKFDREKWVLYLFYISGTVLLAFYLLVPDSFLLPSLPKMYFPNYYDAGQYYWVVRLYIFVVSAYFTYHALREYFTTQDVVIKNRLRYVIMALVFAYFTGSTAVFLVFDVQIDPLISCFMSLYLIPLGYVTFRYKLVEINIIARQAFVYGLMVTILTSVVAIGSFSNLYISTAFPDFPIWLMPVATSAIAVIIGVLVWRKMRENDLLKYEFITVVTHKFRTPLTHIKWATELLLSQEQDLAKKHELENVRESNRKLIDLTSTLIAVADADRSESSLYKFEKIIFGDIVAEAAAGLRARVEERKIAFSLERWDNGALIRGDRERIKFIAQTLIENAISYSPIGGTVVAAVETSSKTVTLRVKDAGIGIAKEELAHLFTKFYRSQRAKTADTEGVGVGLFLIKSIIDRHGGVIEADSMGVNQGTTFLVTFPKLIS